MQYDEYISIRDLLARREAGSLDDNGLTQLEAWLERDPVHLAVFGQIDDPAQLQVAYERYVASRERMRAQLASRIPVLNTAPVAFSTTVHRVHFLKRWGWAAAIMILLSGTVVYLLHTQKEKQPIVSVPVKNDILPGGQKATLTLADGRKIVLDSAKNGQLTVENGSEIVKRGDEIIYERSQSKTESIVFNTMTTPKGGQYKLVLPDGSRVWLNAASSITFPASFVGRNRTVTVSGEVYFEVVKNKSQPFVVNVNNESTVQVLGTSFNINSYGDKGRIITTLIDGSIRIGTDRGPVLRPGQQAVATSPGQVPAVKNNADIAKVMAWKNGLFNFDGLDLQDMMHQFERWYDVTVVYEAGVPDDIVFKGEMQRDLNLSEALEILKGVGINYRIEQNRKVIITP